MSAATVSLGVTVAATLTQPLRRTVGNATLQASVNTHGYGHVTYGSVLAAHFGLAALLLAAVEVGVFAGFDAPAKKAK